MTGAGGQSEGGMHEGWAEEEEEVRKSLRRSFSDKVSTSDIDLD